MSEHEDTHKSMKKLKSEDINNEIRFLGNVMQQRMAVTGENAANELTEI